MITIGSAKIGTNIFLAPLAGHSDLPFRMISREYGCGLCFFEMLDAHCLIRDKREAYTVLNTIETDRPIAAQLLGNDPDIMLRAAEMIIERVKISFLDINAACPVKKVVKRRSGAYLLRDHTTLFAIINRLASSLSIPVTIKIRTGYENSDPAIIADMAKRCESNGAAAIFVHGRTRTQGYAGDIDYASIKAVKDSIKIPVFGSGNIFDAGSAKRMFNLTNCDGILVARGAMGNPRIFRQIESIMGKDTGFAAPDMSEKKALLKKHLEYIDRYIKEPDRVMTSLMRRAALYYLKAFPNAAEMRQKASLAKNREEMFKLLY